MNAAPFLLLACFGLGAIACALVGKDVYPHAKMTVIFPLLLAAGWLSAGVGAVVILAVRS